jgi:hypothetical protein
VQVREKKKAREKTLQESNKSLESPRRVAIGMNRHARKSSTSSGTSSPENTSARRMEVRRRRSSRVALRSTGRARRILQHSLDLDNLDLRDALDRLDDDGGLHDHDDGLRGH